jgi:putative endonuclease
VLPDDTSVSETRQVGDQGERLAERFLRRLGYKILARNYRCRAGEMDLIARDGKTTVFVEVKARSDSGLGDPEENVGPGKQRRLTQIARCWLGQGKHGGPCRFDIVAIEFDTDPPTIRHLIDAFEPKL